MVLLKIYVKSEKNCTWWIDSNGERMFFKSADNFGSEIILRSYLPLDWDIGDRFADVMFEIYDATIVATGFRKNFIYRTVAVAER